MKSMKAEFDKAHSHSFNNQSEINASALCGCFNCLARYPPCEVQKWVVEQKGEKTAICPACGIDTVIGSDSGFELDADFLRMMQAEFLFGYS